MKFKSALVTQVSGSIGGLTGSHNKGGMYFRSRSIPTNPSTSRQQDVRQALAALAAAWVDTVSDVNKASWATYAENVPIVDALGEPRQIPALAHFVRSNVSRIQNSLAVISAAPVTFDLGTFTDPTASATASTTIQISFTAADAWANETGAAMLVYASKPQNDTINSYKGPYMSVGKIDGNSSSPPSSPASFTLPNPVSTGQKVFVQTRVTRADGRLSSPFRTSDVR